jgi:hypothetical protein
MAGRPSRQRIVEIAGSRWRIQRARLRNAYGLCDYASRTIKLDSRLAGSELLDTLIHELIHARWPDLSEDAVIEFANLLTHVLELEGYQRAE